MPFTNLSYSLYIQLFRFTRVFSDQNGQVKWHMYFHELGERGYYSNILPRCFHLFFDNHSVRLHIIKKKEKQKCWVL